jgi:hypothetical protein
MFRAGHRSSPAAGFRRLVQGAGIVVGQVQEPDHPGLPLDERADRGALLPADDEVSLPVPGWVRSAGWKDR